MPCPRSQEASATLPCEWLLLDQDTPLPPPAPPTSDAMRPSGKRNASRVFRTPISLTAKQTKTTVTRHEDRYSSQRDSMVADAGDSRAPNLDRTGGKDPSGLEGGEGSTAMLGKKPNVPRAPTSTLHRLDDLPLRPRSHGHRLKSRARHQSGNLPPTPSESDIGHSDDTGG